MTNSNITWSSIPNFVGFNDLMKDFEHLMDRSTYPPYNVYTEKMADGGIKYYIEMAVTGLSKEEVSVTVENSRLVIEAERKASNEATREIIYSGLSKKGFVRSFVLRPDIVVNNAKVVDGLLTVELEYVVPDTKKRRAITVE